ncbi:MFS transporter [Qipengyuania qiaonensis]|nr:MFS transporter [Qipengyuania qiaonensis]
MNMDDDLSAPRQLLYSTGNFGKNILASSIEVLLLFVLTEMLDIEPAIAGLLILSTLIVDALLDPVVGVASDRTYGRFGRYGPYILSGAPLCAITFAAIFALPASDWANLFTIGAALFGFRIAYSLIDLPHNALIMIVAPGGAMRSRIVIFRFFFSTLATLAVALLLRPITESGAASGIIAKTGLAIAVLSCFVMIVSYGSVARIDRSRHQSSAGKQAEARNNAGHFAAVGRSRHFWAIIGIGILTTLSLPLFPKSLLYVATEVIGDITRAPDLLTAMVVGQFVGILVWLLPSSRFGSSTLLQASYAVAGAGFCTCYIMLKISTEWLEVGAFLIGLGAAGAYSLIWALIADVAETIARTVGAQAQGAIFAFCILSQKAAIGVGSLLLGLSLDLGGYGEPNGSAATAILLCAWALPLLLLIANFWLCRTVRRATSDAG